MAEETEESISRREQILDSGFEDWDLDMEEKRIFGFVAPKLWTDKQLDRWLKQEEQKNGN